MVQGVVNLFNGLGMGLAGPMYVSRYCRIMPKLILPFLVEDSWPICSYSFSLRLSVYLFLL